MSYLMSRSYYKARILLVPLGKSGNALVNAMSAAGLREVKIATAAVHPDGVYIREISAPESETSIETINDRIADTDMMVFLGSQLNEIPNALVESMTEAGQSQGTLMACVLVGADGWGSQASSESVRVLRRELDMLITVRKLDLAQSFIDVLKGGTSESTPGKLFQHSMVRS